MTHRIRRPEPLAQTCRTGIIVGLCLALGVVCGCETGKEGQIWVPSCKYVYDVERIAQMVTEDYSTRVEKMSALYVWVRDYIDYELSYWKTRTPKSTLKTRTGDCGDKSRLLAALLQCIGEQAYNVQVFAEPERPNHRFLGIPATRDEVTRMSELTGGGGTWMVFPGKGHQLVPMDTVREEAYVGWIRDIYFQWTDDNTWVWTYDTRIWRAKAEDRRAWPGHGGRRGEVSNSQRPGRAGVRKA